MLKSFPGEKSKVLVILEMGLVEEDVSQEQWKGTRQGQKGLCGQEAVTVCPAPGLQLHQRSRLLIPMNVFLLPF